MNKKQTTPITEHQGNKYVRLIQSCEKNGGEDGIAATYVDVYEVLRAFNVTCPARQHAIKKLLCAGLRDKGSELDDLWGVYAALMRAIEIQEREESETEDKLKNKHQEIMRDIILNEYEMSAEKFAEMGRRIAEDVEKKIIGEEAKWEAYPVMDDNGKTIGYRPRWNANGFCLDGYNESSALSLARCLYLVEQIVYWLNFDERKPEEFK